MLIKSEGAFIFDPVWRGCFPSLISNLLIQTFKKVSIKTAYLLYNIKKQSWIFIHD